jgi:hypothetical protein
MSKEWRDPNDDQCRAGPISDDDGAGGVVAQICNLLYRGIAFRKAPENSRALEFPERRRFQIGLPAEASAQAGDTAQRGEAATKTASGLPGRSGSKRPARTRNPSGCFHLYSLRPGRPRAGSIFAAGDDFNRY